MLFLISEQKQHRTSKWVRSKSGPPRHKSLPALLYTTLYDNRISLVPPSSLKPMRTQGCSQFASHRPEVPRSLLGSLERVTRHSERGPSRPRAVSCRQQPFHPTIQAYALAPPPRKHTGRDVAGWQHHASGDSTLLPRELSRRSPETDR